MFPSRDKPPWKGAGIALCPSSHHEEVRELPLAGDAKRTLLLCWKRVRRNPLLNRCVIHADWKISRFNVGMEIRFPVIENL